MVSQQIEATLSRNWNAFEIWQGQNHATRTFNLPQDAAQVFIPGRILEFSENPNNVHASLRERSSHLLDLLIFERLDRALTDPERFNRFIEEHKKEKISPGSQEESPEGVDYKHIRHQSLLESGELTFNDRIFINYSAYIPDGYSGVAFTRYYSDRKELQRKGIASSFYERLETVLSRLEFKYLVGNIVSSHPEFFEKNRISYSKLPKAVKKELPLDLRNLHTLSIPQKVMVRIL